MSAEANRGGWRRVLVFDDVSYKLHFILRYGPVGIVQENVEFILVGREARGLVCEDAGSDIVCKASRGGRGGICKAYVKLRLSTAPWG